MPVCSASPAGRKEHGFFWSHVGWFTCRANFPTRLDVVPDFARFPELRFLDRFDSLVPVRQGFFWWEIDVTFYLLKLMSWLGLIWRLSPVPEKARRSGLLAAGDGRDRR